MCCKNTLQFDKTYSEQTTVLAVATRIKNKIYTNVARPAFSVGLVENRVLPTKNEYTKRVRPENRSDVAILRAI
jgi:hypothetical protein